MDQCAHFYTWMDYPSTLMVAMGQKDRHAGDATLGEIVETLQIQHAVEEAVAIPQFLAVTTIADFPKIHAILETPSVLQCVQPALAAEHVESVAVAHAVATHVTGDTPLKRCTIWISTT